jgi:hypothetical protein
MSLCAFPAPPRVSFAPLRVPNASTQCEADRDAIRRCPLFLSYSFADGDHVDPVCHRIRRKLLRTKQREGGVAAGGSSEQTERTKPTKIAIVGDSMARQAFAVLISRVRGLNVSLDFNVHHPVRYFVYTSEAARSTSLRKRRAYADVLDLPHGDLPLLGRKLDGTRRTTHDWAAERVADTEGMPGARGANRRAPAFEALFTWAPCSYDMQAASRRLHSHEWSSVHHVVLFAPAYWHLTSACGREVKHQLNATREAVMAIWQPWIAASLNRSASSGTGSVAAAAAAGSTSVGDGAASGPSRWYETAARATGAPRFTVVTPPIENLGSKWLAKQRALNDALVESFSVGAFPPTWSLFDWASLMAEMRPGGIVPTGDQKSASWHYACQFYRHASWYLNARNHTVFVMTHANGDCADSGNTALWERVLMDVDS